MCALCVLMHIMIKCLKIFSLSAEIFRAYMKARTHRQATPHSPIDSRRGLTASKTNLRTDDEAAVDDDDDGDS